jgi:hypothetical protein
MNAGWRAAESGGDGSVTPITAVWWLEWKAGAYAARHPVLTIICGPADSGPQRRKRD